MAETRQAQERHHVEQGILPVGSLGGGGLDEQLIGIGQRLERVFEDVFGARAVACYPQVFSEGDQGIYHLIAVLADHIERIEAHRIVGIRQIDQHHVVPLARGNQPTQRVNHVAVWLDEGQTWG